MTKRKWTRRQVLALSGTAALGAAWPIRPAPAGGVISNEALPAVSARDARFYDRAFVLDANTLASIGLLQDGPHFARQLAAIRQSGLSVLKSTLGGADGDFEQAVADLAGVQALVDRYPQVFIKVTRPADLARAKTAGKIALIQSFEAVSMLEGKLERIDLFRRLDVLVMQLSYNHMSAFGCGCLDGDTRGLTALGRRAVARMNEIGVALDLSHANAQTTAQGIAASRRPAVITHAGCRAVYEHPRNKRDRDMRALADKGGVMGIYMLPFLTRDSHQPVLADYMRHMVHALNVCGEDHVGIGSDSLFFTATEHTLRQIETLEARRRKAGIGAPGENRPPYLPDINTPRKLEYVADALLRHGYGAWVTDKVLGLNFRRVFDAIWRV